MPNKNNNAASPAHVKKLYWLAPLLLLLSLSLLLPNIVSAQDPTPTPTPAEANTSPLPPPPITHTVKAGETLFEIALQYSTTVEAITGANDILDASLISIGQRLIIPQPGQTLGPAVTYASVVALPGDDLQAIARRFDTPTEQIAQINGVLNPSLLSPGQTLLVENAVPVRVHVVSEGETTTNLAMRYGLSTWNLAASNNLTSPTVLQPDQQLIIPLPIITANISSTLPAPFESLDIGPLPAVQGQSLQVRVAFSQEIKLSGAFADKMLNFAYEDGAYYALVGINAFANPGDYPLALLVTDTLGSQIYLSQNIELVSGGYGRELIQIPPDRSNLLDPALIRAEIEWLQSLKVVYNPERYWQEPLRYPVESIEITSEFGTRRSYNGGPYSSFHSGTDLNGVEGDVIYAPAPGVVIAAQELTVRGNVILIDHGWGLYTGYWHLSQIDVIVGQRVETGEVIGLLGNTGLSTGAHLHWECWVGGESVNALQWVEQTFFLLYPSH